MQDKSLTINNFVPPLLHGNVKPSLGWIWAV